jgi:uncharacterized FlaG/YvyC family protein
MEDNKNQELKSDKWLSDNEGENKNPEEIKENKENEEKKTKTNSKKTENKNKKVNYWLQALNYYISISTQSTKSYLGNYIIEVLDHLSNTKDENFSPMILLDILDKARSNHGHIIEFKVIKKYIIDWIKKQQESLKNDKKRDRIKL